MTPKQLQTEVKKVLVTPASHNYSSPVITHIDIIRAQQALLAESCQKVAEAMDELSEHGVVGYELIEFYNKLKVATGDV